MQRAFALDSRTVWVEQQHVNAMKLCLPRENLPLGPGEYTPKLFERNISTPYIGKREIFEGYQPSGSAWSSKISSSNRSNHSSQKTLLGHRSDNVTVFHEHDIRQPFDPKLRFCETPAPSLTHDPILYSQPVSGGHKVIKVEFGKSEKERFSAPDQENGRRVYDPKYDSQHLKPRLKLGQQSIVGHKNPFEPMVDKYKPHVSKGGPMSPSEEHADWRPKCQWKGPTETGQIIFDASSYQHEKVPDKLCPSRINKETKANVFRQMLMTPIAYRSKPIGTEIRTQRFRGSDG